MNFGRDYLPTTMSVLVLLYDHPTKAGDSRKMILAIWFHAC